MIVGCIAGFLVLLVIVVVVVTRRRNRHRAAHVGVDKQKFRTSATFNPAYNPSGNDDPSSEAGGYLDVAGADDAGNSTSLVSQWAAEDSGLDDGMYVANKNDGDVSCFTKGTLDGGMCVVVPSIY